MPTRSNPAPAKVNLFLHVGRRRADGYHDLTSLVMFPDLGDVVTVSSSGVRDDEEGGGIAFSVDGPFAEVLREEERRLAPLAPSGHSPQHAGGRIEHGQSSPARAGEVPERSEGEGGKRRARPRGFPPSSRSATLPPADAGGRFKNLVLRAAEELADGRDVQAAKIVLTKNLPIASGIGGGSADAAATLRALNEFWGLRLNKDDLRAIGLKIGSDVPVCIDPKPQWMEGRGERVERGPRMPEFYMTLVNPGVPVPTGPVFKALTKKSGAKRPPAPKSFSSARSLSAWLAAETRNDLQAPAIQIAPPVADVLAALEAQSGCLLARMSGSGATCFGVFETAREAKRAGEAMPGEWWAKAASCGSKKV
jgi:4-diphosphocytidyl-2-C-methyl-D-erythritol kinase